MNITDCWTETAVTTNSIPTFHFHRCKHWGALFTYISTRKQEFYYSNVTQFFKLLPAYLPKITPWSIIKSLFNDLSADRWVGSFFDFIWRLETTWRAKGTAIVTRFPHQYFTLSFCLPPQRLLPVRQGSIHIMRWGMGEKGRWWRGVLEDGRIKQAWCPSTGICWSDQFQEGVQMEAEGLKTKPLPTPSPRMRSQLKAHCSKAHVCRLPGPALWLNLEMEALFLLCSYWHRERIVKKEWNTGGKDEKR